MTEIWEIIVCSPDIIIDKELVKSEENFEILVHQVMRGEPAPVHPYISLERLRRYLYRVTFDTLPEDNGSGMPVIGGCSAYVQGGKLYRNYDWNYDNAASFIVRTRDFEGMSMITGLDDGAMDDSKIAQLPYRMVDGRNNNGIMLSTHILFNDWQWTGAGEKSIPLTRLPFLVLSRVKSMATIASDLAGVLGNLTSTPGLDNLGYLIQLLITDGTTTYALIPPLEDGQGYELVDATSNPKMSNFRWVASRNVVRQELQTRPTGVERWNMMPCPLEELRFTKAYEAPIRLSEFIGLRETTRDSTDAQLLAIYDSAHEAYIERTRDGLTWQTMHSVVYGDAMEALYVQEDFTDNLIGGVTAERARAIAAEAELRTSINAEVTRATGAEHELAERVSDIEAKEDGWDAKQDAIEDLDDIRDGASKGATALQSVPSTYRTASSQDAIDNGMKQRLTAIEEKEAGWDAKADLSDIPEVVDGVTSTSTAKALSANQGKALNDRINNLLARGRFLSFWDATTGMPLTNPSGYPYEYHTGDYFIVNKVGETNYIPNGATYTGQPSTTVYTGDLKPNDSIYYDGTSWSVFDTPAGSGDIQDVYVNGSSVVVDGIAYVVTPTTLAALNGDSTHRVVTDVQIAAWNAKQGAIADLQTIREGAVKGATSVQGAEIDGASIVDADKVVKIPKAGANQFGVVKVGNGIAANNGVISTDKATDAEVVEKTNQYKPIVPANLDKAVMEGLGNNSLTWSDAYKAHARQVLGASAPITIQILEEGDN